MLVTMLDYALFHTNFEMMTYWFATIVLILVASKGNIKKATPYKLIFWSAFVAMIGVYFQWFFLPVFNARVAPLFHVDAIDFIKDAYGMRGFTPQQGTTSVILIFGEIVILYLREKALPKIFHNNIAYWLLIVLLIGSIFLTGKRTIAALSLAIPLVIYLLSSGRGMHRVLRLFAVAGILVLGYELLPYLSQSSEFYSIQRFSLTVEQLQSGEDVISVREYLWDAAIKAFHENPIFGIGVGKFGAYTNLGTDTHNTYLQVLCEQGIIGFILYILGIICCLFHSIRALDIVHDLENRNIIQAALGMQLVFILYALTGNVNIDIDVIYFYLATALIIQIETIDIKQFNFRKLRLLFEDRGRKKEI